MKKHLIHAYFLLFRLSTSFFKTNKMIIIYKNLINLNLKHSKAL